MRPFADGSVELPGTDLAARDNLALPIGTDLASDAVNEVVAAVRRCLDADV